MSKKVFVRIWQDMELDDIEKHLLIAGELTGDCSNCREVGIDIINARTCPKCNTEFKYIATRLGGGATQARRLKAKRNDLTFIEFLDFKEARARKDAQNFLE
jgi:hypothetical protein